jgi:hypothetical protein
MPFVGIILINWNGLEDTVECLESLRHIDYPNYRIVVVDNGSEHDEAVLLKQRFPETTLIANPKNEGFAKANNQGIEWALAQGADYVLLLNNDTVVDPDFLSILMAYAEAEPCVGIVGPLIRYYGSERTWFAGGWINHLTGLLGLRGKRRNYRLYHGEPPREVDFIVGCALLVRREVIEKIGLLDEAYFAYYEDCDWCLRARRAGYGVRLVPQSVIEHKKSASSGFRGQDKLSSIQAYLWGRNGIIFARKNLAGWRRWTFTFGQFTFRLAHAVAMSRSTEGIGAYLRGLRDGLAYPDSPPEEVVPNNRVTLHRRG